MSSEDEDWEETLPLKIVCMIVHFDPLPELVPPEFDKHAFLAYHRQSKVFMAMRTTEEGPTAGGKNFFDVDDDEPNIERAGEGGVILRTTDNMYELGKRLHMHHINCQHFGDVEGLEHTIHSIQAWVMQGARAHYWYHLMARQTTVKGAADAISDEPEPLRTFNYMGCYPYVGLREIEEVWRRPIDAEEIKGHCLDFVTWLN